MSNKSSAGKGGKGRGPQRAREEAARQMAAKRRAELRQRAIWVTAIVVVVVVAAGLIGYILYQQSKPKPAAAAPKAATSTAGIPYGKASAPVTLDLYEDFQCPNCRDFEQTVGPTITKLVDAGKAKVVFHPIAILDRSSSGTKYSTRSSAASGCASDAGVFQKYVDILFANQPAEGSSGLTNTKLVDLGKQVGATSASFAGCVTSQKYAGWTGNVTDKSSKRGVQSTPTAFVNGTELDRAAYTPNGLTAAVSKAGGKAK